MFCRFTVKAPPFMNGYQPLIYKILSGKLRIWLTALPAESMGGFFPHFSAFRTEKEVLPKSFLNL